MIPNLGIDLTRSGGKLVDCELLVRGEQSALYSNLI